MMRKLETGLELTIFWSRWLQAPIYVGLILAQVLYCYKFAREVIHLLSITEKSTEMAFLLAVLTLIDIAMVANLITMVVIGGYATFVRKLMLIPPQIIRNGNRLTWRTREPKRKAVLFFNNHKISTLVFLRFSGPPCKCLII